MSSDHSQPESQSAASKARKSWLKFNANANGINVFATLLAGIAAFGGLYMTSLTIEENTKLVWRNFLDEKGKEIGATLISDNSPQSCVYNYGKGALKQECEEILFKNAESVLAAYSYVEELLSHLREVRIYDDENDDNYFRWYQGSVNDLAEDPYGIVSYVLYDAYDCKNAECYSCWYSNVPIEDANLACVINIRIINEDDQDSTKWCQRDTSLANQCIANLLRNREKFIGYLEAHRKKWKAAG